MADSIPSLEQVRAAIAEAQQVDQSAHTPDHVSEVGIALEPLSIGGVLAYNVGDAVPADVIESQGWHVGEAIPEPAPEPDPIEYVVATADLYLGTVKAHNVGDLVPADNVARHGWDDLVSQQHLEAPAGEPASVEYDTLLKADLEKIAEERGLDATGKKADIVARLHAADVAS